MSDETQHFVANDGTIFAGVADSFTPEALDDIREAASLEEAVMLSLGAASACWDNLGGAGVFQPDEARQIGEALLDRIAKDVPAPDMPKVAEHERSINEGSVRSCDCCGRPPGECAPACPVQQAVTSWMHTSDGVFWRRFSPDGYVEIVIAPEGRFSGAEHPDTHPSWAGLHLPVEPLMCLGLPASSWCSVVAHLSAFGDNHEGHAAAMAFHDGRLKLP